MIRYFSKTNLKGVDAKRLALTVGITCAMVLHASIASAVSPLERTALDAIYTSLHGNAWNPKTNWEIDPDPCNWDGVSCSGAGQVLRVEVSGFGLTGSIPDLSGLTNIQYLDFDNNRISGSIPVSMLKLSTLEEIHIGNNLLSGNIPAIGSMASLQVIVVDGNFLTGSIPALGTHLATFSADYNFLSGQIPTLSGLKNLINFQIEHNHVSGAIPSLPNGGSLNTFDVAYNALSGNLPPVPNPNTLLPSDSTLCPNNLTKRSDMNWDIATGTAFDSPPTSWYYSVVAPGELCSDLIFTDGFDPRDLPPL
jgi:Leucine rich repeat N-terminal domain